MERCRICGAALFEGISWCTQCLTPLPESGAAAGRARRSEPGRVVVVAEVRNRSVIRGGATTFGILGKVVITALVVGIGVGAYLLLDSWARTNGSPLRALQLVIPVAYALLAAIFMRSVWRMEPRRTIVLPDPPAARQGSTPREDAVRVENHGVRVEDHRVEAGDPGTPR